MGKEIKVLEVVSMPASPLTLRDLTRLVRVHNPDICHGVPRLLSSLLGYRNSGEAVLLGEPRSLRGGAKETLGVWLSPALPSRYGQEDFRAPPTTPAHLTQSTLKQPPEERKVGSGVKESLLKPCSPQVPAHTQDGIDYHPED